MLIGFLIFLVICIFVGAILFLVIKEAGLPGNWTRIVYLILVLIFLLLVLGQLGVIGSGPLLRYPLR